MLYELLEHLRLSCDVELSIEWKADVEELCSASRARLS
jgi:hypothetical protein